MVMQCGNDDEAGERAEIFNRGWLLHFWHVVRGEDGGDTATITGKVSWRPQVLETDPTHAEAKNGDGGIGARPSD